MYDMNSNFLLLRQLADFQIRVRMKTPDITVSVLQELIRRGGIKAALAGRDEKSLAIILKFLQK